MTTATLSRGSRLRSDLGEGIRKARLKTGLTQREAASQAGISFSYWCDLEHGRKQASFEVIDQICQVLDISMAALFGYMFRSLLLEVTRKGRRILCRAFIK